MLYSRLVISYATDGLFIGTIASQVLHGAYALASYTRVLRIRMSLF